MTDNQIVQEILRYIEDTTYNYAVLIDGEWGCGKTFFVKNSLIKAITLHEKERDAVRKVKYISLYGCKTANAILENIVWSIAAEVPQKSDIEEEAARKTIAKVSQNILLTSKKVASAAIKKFSPNMNPYDIVSDWLMMRSYILVFDDLERCDCPINEVFGLINGFVEHEDTKVIIVANEKEIGQASNSNPEALDYMVSLDSTIEWPKEETYVVQNKKVQSPGKITIDELEARKKLLFPPKDKNEEYKRIREKLIGETLRYNPNVKEICEGMIRQSTLSDREKELVLLKLKEMQVFMDTHNHHNLRTFQFFLSKICFLFGKIDEIVAPDDIYYKTIKEKVIDNCFISTVYYKANILSPKRETAWVGLYDQHIFNSVQLYVKEGELVSEELKSEVESYKGALTKQIPADDPYNLLKEGFYYHTQEWCELRLEEFIANLKKDTYHFSIYPQMIIILCRFIKYGFDERYLTRVKEIMIKNIECNPDVEPFIVNHYNLFIDDLDLLSKIQSALDELNQAIDRSTKKNRYHTVNEILKGKNWAKELEDYVDSQEKKFSTDFPVFYQAESDLWCEAIERSDLKEINTFRHVLSCLYPPNHRKESLELDYPVIVEIKDKLNSKKSEDIVRNLVMGWLTEQCEEIIARKKDS